MSFKKIDLKQNNEIKNPKNIEKKSEESNLEEDKGKLKAKKEEYETTVLNQSIDWFKDIEKQLQKVKWPKKEITNLENELKNELSSKALFNWSK